MFAAGRTAVDAPAASRLSRPLVAVVGVLVVLVVLLTGYQVISQSQSPRSAPTLDLGVAAVPEPAVTRPVTPMPRPEATVPWWVAMAPNAPGQAPGAPTARPRATPKPAPKTTPKPAPRPTPGGWTAAAVKTAYSYTNSADRTYGTDVPRSVEGLSSIDCSGMTGEECYYVSQEGATWVKLARASINKHLTFMKRHPAANCFRDAYAADRKTAKSLLSALSGWHAGTAGEMRYQNQRIQAVARAADRFWDKLNSYFKDCR